jgi:hypothetical protein
MSPILGRPIRQDGLDTIGISTQTLLEDALAAGHWELGTELATYYVAEIRIMNDALFTWLADILDYRLSREITTPAGMGATLLAGLRAFDPGRGDLDRCLLAIADRRADDAVAAVELMRVRWAAQHDGLVSWIQSLLADIAGTFGEEAVLESVTLAYQHLWKPRYARWAEMTPEERLQLSVEGMRGGHLSGPRHRGDVDVTDEGDRYVMALDPCGSCGILRRGDPDSGRPSQRPAGNEAPHPWTWGRTGMSWYSIHSPIALEYLQMVEGRPPLRPLEDCDLPDRPCRWFIYKDPDHARSIDYERMGFRPPSA